MGLLPQKRSILILIYAFHLFVSVNAQLWTQEFPFLWMEDDFSVSGPSSSLWSWTGCMSRTPPFQDNDLGITGSAAFLMTNNSACYLTPSNAPSTWVLPIGSIRGVAIRVSMHGGGMIPQYPNFLHVPCCHNATTQAGIEYGVRSVSYANFQLGQSETRPCSCGAAWDGRCSPPFVRSYEVWSVGPTLRVPKGDYWWQVTEDDPRTYCATRPAMGAYCTDACNTVTTIKAIPGVSGEVNVEVPEMPNGATLAPVNVSTSVVSLSLTAARRFQFLRFGSAGTRRLDYFNSVNWLLGMRNVAFYLPGQCYDNNSVNGDGCSSTNFVELMCRCAPDANKFKFSVCSCPAASNLLTTAGINFEPSSFVNPDAEIIVSGTRNQTRMLAYSKRTTFVLNNCPHSRLSCIDTRIARYLRLSINGTWQAPVQPVFNKCPDGMCPSDRYIIDLHGLFAPFEYGTELQFIWWMNAKPGSAAGLLDRNGPVFAVSPRMTLTRLIPNVTPVRCDFLLAQFAANVTFASNVRDPDAIQVFMYEGTPWGAHAATNISDIDPLLTRLDGNCTTSPFGEPIRHWCSINIPAPRFPDNNLYLVARVIHGECVGALAPINVTVGANSFRSWNVEPKIAQDTSKTSLHFDATALRPDMAIKIYAGQAEVRSTEILRTRTRVSFNLTIPAGAAHFIFPSAGPLIVSFSDGKNQINTTISMIFPTPVVAIDSPSYQYFLENDTVLIFGAGFDPSNPSSHRVTLIQENAEGRSKCFVEKSFADHIICRLQRDSMSSSGLQEGAIFAAIQIYDSIRWEPSLIGFYLPISVFDQVIAPDGVDLSSVPKLQFRLNASLPGRQTPPEWNVINSIHNFLGRLFGLDKSTDLFSNFVYRSTSAQTTYDLDVWFTSAVSAVVYNQRGIASNFSLLAEIQQIIVFETSGIYDVTLLSSSVSRIDPAWPFLIHKLSVVKPERINPPTRQEITVVRSVAATLWGISSSGLFAQSRASLDGSGYEFTIYFIDSASRAKFLQYKLPANESVVGGLLDSIISSATNNDFTSSFLRGSSFSAPSATQIDISWPWMRFLLTSTIDSEDSALSTDQLNSIQLSSSQNIGVTNLDLFLLLTTMLKRAVGDQYLLTLYFSSPASQRVYTDAVLRQNQTFIASFNNIVSNTTSGAFNSTFLTDSTAVAPTDAFVLEDRSLPLSTTLSIAVPITFVALVIIVVFAVIYRRRYAQLRRIEQSVEKLPDELKSVLSIKSGEIILGGKIGEGSFGAVFRAKFRGRQVAVKQLSSNMLSAQIADFFREASTMMAIKPHRNVIRMLGMCQELNNFSMVMEFCPEGSLDQLLHKKDISPGKSLSKAEIFHFARGIALGMRHLAAAGIVHRDLAARNILLDSNYVPKIADFGFSRVIGANSTGKTNTSIGPIRWMSPENIREQSYSEKSDVWAYGATLIELITGDEPFPGISPVECAVWVRDGVATPLNYVPIGVSVPQWVFTLIGRCFTYDQSQRPSFDDVVTFLNQNIPEGVTIDSNEETPTMEDGNSRQQNKKSKKNKNKRNKTKNSEPDVQGTEYTDIQSI